ncbi:MAG: hypothetical protein ACHQTE_01820 [Candidatus Saccharimonadales bacterium]
MDTASFKSERTQGIPIIESGIFDVNQDARFAIGMVALGDVIMQGRENEFWGAAKLRSNVYLDKGFVTPTDLDENGTELDYDDSRSIHFAVFERTAVSSLARVVANMRLIVKGIDEPPLPLEKYYPEVFEACQAMPTSTEVSRLISRHEDPTIQNMLTWSMFIAGLKHVDKNNLGPVYGLLEPNLARGLVGQGVPVSVIAEEKYIARINATKQPVQIDVERLKKVVAHAGDFGIDLHQGNLSYLDFKTDRGLVGIPSQEVA